MEECESTQTTESWTHPLRQTDQTAEIELLRNNTFILNVANKNEFFAKCEFKMRVDIRDDLEVIRHHYAYDILQ